MNEEKPTEEEENVEEMEETEEQMAEETPVDMEENGGFWAKVKRFFRMG